jgi:hypothetical protein
LWFWREDNFNELKKILIISAIPILYLAIFSSLKIAQGPYYNSMLYDPSYVYLISSLNIAQGVGAAHIDHPGSTVQLIGGVVVKTLYTAFGNSSDIVESVFLTPESYVSSIYFALIFINALGLFIMGYILKNAGLISMEILFLQMSPLLCFTSYIRLTQVSSEIFLVFTFSLMIAYLIRYRNLEPLYRESYKYALIFGVLCGLSVVTKLTTLPFMLLPFFLLKGISKKIVLVIVAATVFLVIFVISSDNSSFFLNYVTNTVTKTGSYGQGDSGFIDTATYTRNFAKIFTTDYLFTFILGISIITTLYFISSKKAKTYSNNNFNRSFIIIYILSTLLLTFLIAKNFFPHYTLPALLYANTAIFVCISMFADTVIYKKYYKPFLRILFFVSFIIMIFVFISLIVKSGDRLSESRKITSFFGQTEGLDILSFGVSSPELALAYGTEYGGANRSLYSSMVSKRDTNIIYFQVHGNKIRKLYSPFTSIDNNELRSILLSEEKVYYYSRKYVARFDNNEAFLKLLKEKLQVQNCRLEKVLENKNHESVFEVIIDE